jgi:putative oligomerization/nucleic acid binding protein
MAQAFFGGTGMPQMPAAAGDDPLDQLERLAELHQRGALTDAEFAAAKAKLLNG